MSDKHVCWQEGDCVCANRPTKLPKKRVSEVYIKDFLDLTPEGAGYSTSEIRVTDSAAELTVLSIYYDEDEDCIWVDVQ
jgi:hypothetical protein